jgi:hypothetical protein
MKIKSVLLMFLLSLSSAFGFSSIGIFDTGFVLSQGFTYQKEKFVSVEGGLGFFDRQYDEMIVGKIGVEKSLESSLTGIKVGFEVMSDSITSQRIFPIKIAFGAGIAHYFGEGERELRIIPEIGISWRSYVSLTYRYGLHVIGDKIDDIGNHGVSLGVNIPF